MATTYIRNDLGGTAHPQLFGAHDPQIVMNAAERKEYVERAKFEAGE